tara:strand:- start:3047 stop:3235 length:189 start_codon:yes stop_codon:yes gene_type:complete
MKCTILNSDTGSAMEMIFESKEQLDRWLELNPNFKNVGTIDYELPTRHVRMKNKDEFAGWGS